MSIITSADYGSLGNYSNVNTAERVSGPFRSVFISTSPREDQDPGRLHCVLDWNQPDGSDEKYLFNNKSEVYFIPMFIKKIRDWSAKTSQTDQFETLRYFSYDPDVDKDYPSEARVRYVFAGVLLDDNLKPVNDPEDPTRSAFICFNNRGVKCSGAIEYLKSLDEAGADLTPLSDDPSFEKTVVLPRRFITKVSKGMGKTKYGDRYIFKYEPFKQLPDKMVVDIMNKCVKWVKPFDEQFDLSSHVKTGNSSVVTVDENQAVDLSDSSEPEPALSADEDIDFDLGL